MGRLGMVALATVGGVIAGILFAPKSGKETRQDIANKATDLKGRASDGLDEFKKGADSVKGEVVSGAEAVKDIATRKASNVKDEADRTSKNVERTTR